MLLLLLMLLWQLPLYRGNIIVGWTEGLDVSSIPDDRTLFARNDNGDSDMLVMFAVVIVFSWGTGVGE